MKICIVGGTGNISLPIVNILLKQGHDVTVFNRNKHGKAPEGARLITGDRKDRKDFEKRLNAEKFDAAIDMICFDREDALSDIRAFSNVSRFIQISTVCTYGVDYDFLPVTEDHPLRPITEYGRDKMAADHAFMAAFHRDGFHVTIVKPSTTFGPQWGLLRQIAWDFSWINRVETGRPILILGEGFAPHQFLHVDDAARFFSLLLQADRDTVIGRTYNLVDNGFTTWRTWHETAMEVIGRKVELVGTTLSQLEKFNVPEREIAGEIFAHNCYYSNAKLLRDFPDFKTQLSLENGIRDVYVKMKKAGDIPVSEEGGWEDTLISALPPEPSETVPHH